MRRVVLPAALLAVAAAQQYWLAPTGSDSASGSKGAPWQTPQRALEQVAQIRATNGGSLPSNVTIFVEPGLYVLSNSLVLDGSNSGSSWNASLTFVATSAEATVWSGAALLSKPSPGPDGTVLFSLPSEVQCLGGCRQLYLMQSCGAESLVGRRNLSATPILHYKSISGTQVAVDGGMLSNLSSAGAATSEMLVYHSWTSGLRMVKSWDPSSAVFELQSAVASKYDSAAFNRFQVRNLWDAAWLGEGEFAIDWQSSRQVMYRPFPGEDPSSCVYGVPNLSEVLQSQSDAVGRSPSFTSFQGISFKHTADRLDACLAQGCNGQSASDGISAAIHLHNASNVQLSQVTVASTGHYGVWLDEGCSNIDIGYSLLSDLGAGGIRIGIPAGGVARDLSQQVHAVTLHDSVIEHAGLIVQSGAGVLVQQADSIVVTHNVVRFLFYTGVSVGWTWGYDPTSVHDVTVSFNDVHDVFMGLLSDGGCVYTLGVQPGTVIENNRCWYVDSAGYGGWGYYTDEGSSFIVFRKNLAVNLKSAGHHQHYGLNNILENNIYAFLGKWDCDDAPGCDNAGIRSSVASPGDGKYSLSSFTSQRNIVLLNHAYSPPMASTAPTGFDNMTFASNIYWSTTNQSNLRFGPTSAPVTWTQWQASGKDVDSLVVDPGFVDAVSGNFSLLPTSPAFKLGIEPIDFSHNGPRPL
jgi:hypothetical protein